MMKSQRGDAGKKIFCLKKLKESELMKLLDKMYKYKTMLSYCLKCKEAKENVNPRVSNTNNKKTMLLLKCAKGGSKKSRFIKEQEASALLSCLGIKTPLRKIASLGNILFK